MILTEEKHKSESEDKLKLEKCNKYSDKYVCNLTRELDEISKLSESHYYNKFRHYILADNWCKYQKCLAIRVPGGTVGGIWFNDNRVIVKISIDANYVVKTYPNNINELIQKYVGEKIE